MSWARASFILQINNLLLCIGSLPPLEESYQMHTTLECQSMQEEYNNLARALAPYIDIFLCETITSIAQAQTAINAAIMASSEKPVWVSFSLQDNTRALLRSGERVEDAVHAVAEYPSVQAILFNCCAPQAVTAGLDAVKGLKLLGKLRIGAYANGFQTTTSEWLTQEGNLKESSELITLPDGEYDNDDIILPQAYLRHARKWVENGASIIGGCCGVGPEHIAELKKLRGG